MALSLQRYKDFPNQAFRRLYEERAEEIKAKQKSLFPVENGHELPQCVIFEILSWLPVTDLLHYKCVCKSWYDIILSRAFISKHLKNYIYINNSDQHRHCLLTQYYVSHAELQLFELFLDENETTAKVLASEVLYLMPMYGSYICGPCDGIYYLYHYDNDERALWNPALNELKVLPCLLTRPNFPSYIKRDAAYGFGLDPVTNDFKAIVIKSFPENIVETDEDSNIMPHPLSVLVYSLATDSWKFCGDLGPNIKLIWNTCYVYVNGCYYWLGSYVDESYIIISFDMVTDTFQELCVPNFEQPASISLGIYDDSLAFFTIHDVTKTFDVWTLNNEERFWTAKFTIETHVDVRIAIGHWKHNKIILECADGKLLLCDPEAAELKDLSFARHHCCRGVYAYMESLVSIQGENQ
ncbi:hypothetical protein BVRB_9g204720 [Beta vulgaris subsp. vulgaris]|nr:hypothetical protein BVRB_9g204720 [Beta vulgaris subsp. vulgaris]